MTIPYFFCGLSRRAGLAILALGCLFFGALPSAQAANIEVDGNNCTLPNAITAANSPSSASCGNFASSAGADTIIIKQTGSLTLTSALPDINSDITILGNGLTLYGNSSYRLFQVNSGAKLTVDNIKLSNGSAGNFDGGAIVSSGSLTVLNSTIASGSARNGGAIYADGGSVTIRNSYLNFNNASNHGGAIDIQGAGVSLTISNSTIADNTASETGGGISFAGGSAALTHLTLVNNISEASSAQMPSGFSWWSSAGGATVSLRNSIISSSDDNADCSWGSGNTPAQNVGNLIHDNSCSPAESGDPKFGTAGGDPLYYPLQSDSPALGIGDGAVCQAFPFDQRGIGRPTSGCDAGAAERDGFNRIYVDGNCTLNDAIKAADTNATVTNSGCERGVADDVATDEIILRRNVTLSGAPEEVDSKMIVDGKGRSVTTSVRYNLFSVNSGGGDLTLRNITLTGGDYQSDGGAVYNLGKLTLQNCLIKDNTATGANGGAIFSHSSAISTTIDRCAFINNSASWAGGAIQSSATLTISNSTFVGNQGNAGGAISIGGGQVTLEHLTIWSNTATISSNGSAIKMSSATVNIFNSIIGNSAASDQILCSGSFNNDTAQRGIITWNGPENDNCGTVTVANPQLGGLSGHPPVLPLGAGSAARGANNPGHADTCAKHPLDQRGAARPSSACDIGAAQYFVQRADDDDSQRGDGDGGASQPQGKWTLRADGSWEWVGPGEPEDAQGPVCTGEQLNKSGVFRVATTYGLCSGAQFNLLDSRAIGIGYVIDAGPIATVDVWGWVTSYVEVCYRGRASTLFLDAATSPRTVSQLASTWDGAWTCAQISSAGTIVFLPADSYLTTPPSSAVSPPQTTALSNCMARLNYALNFRESPGGEMMSVLPYGVTLTAFQRADGWVEVDYHGQRGWVSAEYVTFQGSC